MKNILLLVIDGIISDNKAEFNYIWSFYKFKY
jgi:hypothetical protein